jgi:hypothetical protein
MRESPDCIVCFLFQDGDGFDRKGHFSGLCRTRRPVASRGGGNKAAILAAREMLDSAFRQNFDDIVPGI